MTEPKEIVERLRAIVEDHRLTCGVLGGAPEECCVLTCLAELVDELESEF